MWGEDMWNLATVLKMPFPLPFPPRLFLLLMPGKRNGGKVGDISQKQKDGKTRSVFTFLEAKDRYVNP